jgi:hypothetical protein
MPSLLSLTFLMEPRIFHLTLMKLWGQIKRIIGLSFTGTSDLAHNAQQHFVSRVMHNQLGYVLIKISFFTFPSCAKYR